MLSLLAADAGLGQVTCFGRWDTKQTRCKQRLHECLCPGAFLSGNTIWRLCKEASLACWKTRGHKVSQSMASMNYQAVTEAISDLPATNAATGVRPGEPAENHLPGHRIRQSHKSSLFKDTAQSGLLCNNKELIPTDPYKHLPRRKANSLES